MSATVYVIHGWFFEAEQYGHEFTDGHYVSVMTIRRTLTAANEYVIRETGPDEDHDIDFDDYDLNDLLEDNGPEGHVSLKDGALNVQRHRDANSGSRTWVDIRTLAEETEPDL